MTPLVWVVVLLLVGLAVMVLEVFVPSGGVLGFLSVVALIVGAIATAFLEQGPWFGHGRARGDLPSRCRSCSALAFRWFPETPLGRRVLPPPPEPDDVVPDCRPPARRSGRSWVARASRPSELLPWGSVEIDGVGTRP